MHSYLWSFETVRRSAFAVLLACFVLGAAVARAQMTCTPLSSPVLMRNGSEAELTADIQIACTGGTEGNVISPSISIAFNTDLTSRLLSGSQNEVLLLVNNPQPADQVADVNVFQGTTTSLTSPLGTYNGVTFSGISLTEPGSDASLLLRITNLRVNTTEVPLPSQNPASIPVIANVSATGFTIGSNAQPTIGYLVPGDTWSLRTPDDSASGTSAFQQCVSPNAALAANPAATGGMVNFNLKASEGFAYAFKPKLGSSTTLQATPGNANFSESGLVNTGLAGDLASAGLANSGTRLMASFSGIPAGVHLFVTVAPSPLGSSSTANAVLVSTDADGAGAGTPVSATTTVMINGTPVGIAPVTLTDGAGTAVWEVTAANGMASESLSFGVVVAYSSGTVQTGQGNVQLYLAPVDPNGTGTKIPRFADTVQGSFGLAVNACTTPLADLAVGTITVPTPTDPIKVAISASIGNNGNAAAGPFDVSVGLYSDAALTMPLVSPKTCAFSGLAAETQTTCDVHLVVPGKNSSNERTEYVGVIADSTNQIVESSKANNTGSTAIEVLPCLYAVTPSAPQISAEGGAFVLGVNTFPGCTWTASSLSSFISGSSTGTGSGTVLLIAAPNPNTTSRTGEATTPGGSDSVDVNITQLGGSVMLGGIISGKSGPSRARVWTLRVGNGGTVTAQAAEITGLTLTQKSGMSCSPRIETALPVQLGTIAGGASTTGNITIDFSGCQSTAPFDVTATLSANGGAATGSIVTMNQLP